MPLETNFNVSPYYDYFDESNLLFGLSVGSPFGLYGDDFYMNVI